MARTATLLIIRNEKVLTVTQDGKPGFPNVKVECVRSDEGEQVTRAFQELLGVTFCGRLRPLQNTSPSQSSSDAEVVYTGDFEGEIQQGSRITYVGWLTTGELRSLAAELEEGIRAVTVGLH